MPKNNLLLLHGALGTKEQFEDLKVKLSKDFHVHDLNFEGHGDCTSINDFSIDLFAENVIDFLGENNIEKTHIFGYSMGGYVALKLAIHQPKVVDRIVTLGTKFNWTPEIAAQEVKMLNPEKIEEKVPAFAQRLAQLHKANDWKEVMNKTAHMMLELGNGKRLSDEDLRSIRNHVLINIGELDNMVSLEESTHAANQMNNGQLKIIKECKHPIEKVNFDVITKVIIDFTLNLEA